MVRGVHWIPVHPLVSGFGVLWIPEHPTCSTVSACCVL